MNGAIRRVEIEMAHACSRLSLVRFGIGIDDKVRIGRPDRKGIAFQVWSLTDKADIQKTSLSEGIKIAIRSARRFQLRFRRGNSAQRLNREAFIRGADRFWINPQAFGG